MKVGVLALQGAFREHCETLEVLGVATSEVRTSEDLVGIDALVLPGGESTTVAKLLVTSGLNESIRDRLREGMPAFGTCAGLILLATDVLDGRPDQVGLGALDVTVRRNAYGTQVQSFEAALDIADLGGGTFPGVFIRAPVIEAVGAGVTVLAEYNGMPVLCASDGIWASTFHPELSGDLRLHQRFLNEVTT